MAEIEKLVPQRPSMMEVKGITAPLTAITQFHSDFSLTDARNYLDTLYRKYTIGCEQDNSESHLVKSGAVFWFYEQLHLLLEATSILYQREHSNPEQI